MKKEDIRTLIGYNTHVVSHFMQNVYNGKLSEHGLTHAQAKVIYLLAVYGQQSQSELQKKLYIQASSMNGIIDSLLKHNRITKETSPTDRRTKMISLTPRGEELYDYIIQVVERIEKEMTSGISDEEKKMLLPLLQKMQENLRPLKSEE